MVDFSNEALVKKYGSWVRVQVAFYDFLFVQGTKLCPSHWKSLAVQEVCDQFADGGDLYEISVKAIESNLPSQEDAWAEFLKEESREVPCASR